MTALDESSLSLGKATVVSIVSHLLFLALIPFLYQRPELVVPERKQIKLVVLRAPRPSPEPEKAAGRTRTVVKPKPQKPKPRPAAKSEPLPPAPPKSAAKAEPVPEKKAHAPLPRVPVSAVTAPMLSSGHRRVLPEIESGSKRRSSIVDVAASYDKDRTPSPPAKQTVRTGRMPEITVLSPDRFPASKPFDVSVRRAGIPVKTGRQDFASPFDFADIEQASGSSPPEKPEPDKSFPDHVFGNEPRLDYTEESRRSGNIPDSARLQPTTSLDHLLDEPGSPDTSGDRAVDTGHRRVVPTSREFMTSVVTGDVREAAVPVGERSEPTAGREGKVRVQTDPGEVEFARGTINTRPRFIHWVVPSYPPWAERMGKEGKVRLRLEVSDTGKVENVTVVENTAGEVLAGAARETAYQWKLEPVLVDGVPVDVVVYKTIYFILEHGD